MAVAVLEVRSRMECAPSFLSSEELGCGAQPGLCYLARSWKEWVVVGPRDTFFWWGAGKSKM